jgi:hypothetical protein
MNIAHMPDHWCDADDVAAFGELLKNLHQLCLKLSDVDRGCAGYPKHEDPEFEKLRASIYARSSVGCCMHIVLDDQNLEDSNILFTQSIAAHDDCREMGKLLLSKTFEERCELLGLDPEQFYEDEDDES